MIRRREFITLMGGGAVGAGCGAGAGGDAGDRVLSSRSPGESNDLVVAFRRGLREAGFIEGQNFLIAFRWAEGRYDRLSALVAELVDLRVAVLFTAGGPPAALAAKAATQTIPVVFSGVSDALRLGVVTSFNRPGGNLTGMSFSCSLCCGERRATPERTPARR